MGKFKDLQSQRDTLEREVAERESRVRARFAALRRNARERYSVGALLVAGVAVGVALEQYVRLRARMSRKPRRKATRPPVARAPAVPLISVLQFVLTALLAPKAARRASRRRSVPQQQPVLIADDHDQSARSASRADHSRIRTGNGLARH